jgi:hypothetical protein
MLFHSPSFACSWEDLHFCHSFLIVPKTMTPLLGWDLLSQLKVQFLLPPGEYYCLPLIESQVDLAIWTDSQTVGRNWTASSHCIPQRLLNSLTRNSAHWDQKSERAWLPLSRDLEQELLVKCSSLHNTSILGVGKKKTYETPTANLILVKEIPRSPYNQEWENHVHSYYFNSTFIGYSS